MKFIKDRTIKFNVSRFYSLIQLNFASLRSKRLYLKFKLLSVIIVLAVVLVCHPVFAQYHIYWGDVHGHTNFSDGKGSIDDYLTYARDVSNLDFAVVSDHDFGNGIPSWHMPKDTWELIQDKVDVYTVDGKFIAIAGYEWTSQLKYWSEYKGGISERLFSGSVKGYNHKNVYFPSRVEYIFSAKDSAYKNLNLLAEAVLKAGGLIQNNHPIPGPDSKDQWDYDVSYYPVIVNTEIYPDTSYYQGKLHSLIAEQCVRDFLNKGGKTGFLRGSDTHEGKPIARTAVFAKELTREAIFEALRHRRNYAISNAKIVLDFKINGHYMGEEIEVEDKPNITIDVKGTDKIEEVAIIRDGSILFSSNPGKDTVKLQYTDKSFEGNSYYYLRVRVE